MESRYRNKLGVGPNEASLNPLITVSHRQPSRPHHKDIWLDIDSSPAVLRWYDRETSTWKL